MRRVQLRRQPVMMSGVSRRGWDVRSRAAGACAGLVVALVALVALAGCGQARVSSAPPEPAFTRGIPAATTVVTTSPPATVAEPPTMVRSTEPHVLITEPPATPVSEPPATTASTSASISAPTSAPTVEGDEPVSEAVAPEAVAVAVDPSAMVIVDDAGVTVPNQSGWAVFDAVLSQRLIPADVAASVAVLVDGELVHRAAFGVRVAGTGEPTEVTDRFRIASISKTITAIVIMQMVEHGELSLDLPVGQLLLDHLGVTPTDPDAPALTVRQLLTHSSGFPKYQPVFFANGTVSYGDAARIGMTGPVAPSPGAYTYSNMNYAVLSVLIEALTGQAYERVVAERLLAPLGFGDMRMTATFDLGPDEVSHNPRAGRNYMEVLGGAGAWNATPTQVATIYNSIDPATGGWKAMSPESMALMRQGVRTTEPSATYGLGIFNYPGDAWGHTGTIERAHSMALVQPDGVTWAISVSGETPSSTGSLRNIMRAALAAAFAN
jgi:D-alanyl-D-alanine carboxypeptidase